MSQPQPPRLTNGDPVIIAIVKDAASPTGVRIVGDPTTHPRQVLALVSAVCEDLRLQCAVGMIEAKQKGESRIVVPDLKLA